MLLFTDQPIITRDDDRLGRRRFSESLAHAVLKRRDQNSFVIGLYGSWGSGKTSIKNMMLEALREQSDTCPLIVEFEPWLWTDVASLTEAFFREIGAKLAEESEDRVSELEATEEQKLKKEKAKQRAKQWRNYTRIFTAGNYGLKGLSLLLAAQGNAAEAVATTLASGQVEELSKVTQFGADSLEAELQEEKTLERSSISLTDLRRELWNSLKERERPMLVVIDDIDRLTADEITALFSLVKANVNFPNIVYLLLFQRDVVEKSLEKITFGSGQDFLEKIVQAGFDIPQAATTSIEELLKHSTAEVLNPLSGSINQYRLLSFWSSGLLPLFENPRDIRRYVNSLSFHIDLLKDEATNTLEVDVIDLMGIEALRVFVPELYSKLAQNKYLLTTERSSGNNQELEKLVTDFLDEAIQSVQTSQKAATKTILKVLFPQIEWFFGHKNHYNSVPWRDALREARICHPKTFDRFFQLSVNARDISQAMIGEIIQSTSDKNRFIYHVLDLSTRNLLPTMLERLRIFSNRIPRDSAVSFLTGLFDVGDTFSDYPVSEFTQGWGQEIVARALLLDYFNCGLEQWAINQHGAGHPWPKENRVDIFRQAFNQTNGFFLPVYLMYYEKRKENSTTEPNNTESDDHNYLLHETDALSLRNLCLGMIRRAASNGRLQVHPRATFVLSCWKEWADETELKEWIINLASTQSGVISIIQMNTGTQTIHALESNVMQRNKVVDLRSLNSLIEVEEIEKRIENFNYSELNEVQNEYIRLFRFALSQTRLGNRDFAIQ